MAIVYYLNPINTEYSFLLIIRKSRIQENLNVKRPYDLLPHYLYGKEGLLCAILSANLPRHTSKLRNLIIIPARGGSKGIPRKNLRPIAGKPLIYYAITAAKSCEPDGLVVVSTDDDEIALFSERFGATVIKRPDHLADDAITLDPVVLDAAVRTEAMRSDKFQNIVTVQPTSPLVLPEDIDTAIKILSEGKTDTVLSVVSEHHLYWGIRNDKPFPKYEKRVNRQELPANFRETGAIIACTREQLDSGSRIGDRISLLEIPEERSLDIDTQNDLNLCESILNRRRIVFVVTGYPAVGLGHAYRAVMLAHQFTQHDVTFLCDPQSQLAIDYIRAHNYELKICPVADHARTCIEMSPGLVINDILDTDAGYISLLKAAGIKVVNFEDLGPGHALADLVINALYHSEKPGDNTLVGPAYFCLRDEFIHIPPHQEITEVKRVLLTFGGVDEGNLTARCLSIIAPLCETMRIGIDIVTGPGYQHGRELQSVIRLNSDLDVVVAESTARISDFMQGADLALTSGGRTVLELMALGVPTVVICQNHRETTHTFWSIDQAVENLGLRSVVTDHEILEAVRSAICDDGKIQMMHKSAMARDLRGGKARVVKKILEVLDR